MTENKKIKQHQNFGVSIRFVSLLFSKDAYSIDQKWQQRLLHCYEKCYASELSTHQITLKITVSTKIWRMFSTLILIINYFWRWHWRQESLSSQEITF